MEQERSIHFSNIRVSKGHEIAAQAFELANQTVSPPHLIPHRHSYHHSHQHHSHQHHSHHPPHHRTHKQRRRGQQSRLIKGCLTQQFQPQLLTDEAHRLIHTYTLTDTYTDTQTHTHLQIRRQSQTQTQIHTHEHKQIKKHTLSQDASY